MTAQIQRLRQKMTGEIQRLPQSNCCTNTKFILPKAGVNAKLSEINAHVNINVNSNKTAQIQRLLQKMTGEIQRLPQSNCCTNTKFILEQVGANTKLSEINAHVNTNVTSNKW